MLTQIFIANSVYALFLYMLRFSDKINDTLFLLGPSAVPVRVPNRLPMFGPQKPEQLPLMRTFLQQQTYLMLDGRRVPCYGNVETIFSHFFVKNFPFYPISDGLWDIQKFPEYLKDPRFKMCYTVPYPGGLDKPHERLEYLDIKALWNAKTQSEKEEFAAYFHVDKPTVRTLENRKVLLVTQPLSEDRITSEQDKIDIYRSIIGQYNPKDVVIKPHPREMTNWASVFPDIPVIPKIVPAELLTLLVPQLDKVATFFSTAACNVVQPEKVDFYAKDFARLIYYVPNRTENGKAMKPIAPFDVEASFKQENAFNWLRLPDDRFYQK